MHSIGFTQLVQVNNDVSVSRSPALVLHGYDDNPHVKAPNGHFRNSVNLVFLDTRAKICVGHD